MAKRKRKKRAAKKKPLGKKPGRPQRTPGEVAENGDSGNLEWVKTGDCVLLKRNPQFLTTAQLAALRASIERDGFVSPILVRPVGGRYEVISGNHRFIAAQQLGHGRVPAVIKEMTAKQAQRLAINLNMIHGDPTAELLAPFLAEMPDDVLSDIHLEAPLMTELKEFDQKLAEHLAELTLPSSITRKAASTSPIKRCRCPTCGKDHIATAPPDGD